MTLQEALQTLAAHPNQQEVVEQMQAVAAKVWQTVFNKGHSTATAAMKPEKDTLEAKVQETEKKLSDADKRIKELETQNPDVAKLQAEHRENLATLETKHREALLQRDTALVNVRKEAALAELRSHLKGKVNEDWVAAKLAAPDFATRLVMKQDGTFDVMQADGKIPLVPPTGKKVLEALADELVEAAPAALRSSNVDRGSQSKDGKGAPVTGKTVFDKIREEVSEEQKARAVATPAELAKRLGGIRSTN